MGHPFYTEAEITLRTQIMGHPFYTEAEITPKAQKWGIHFILKLR